VVEYLSKQQYDAIVLHYQSGHWGKADERWIYHQRASTIAQTVAPRHPSDVLEIGTMGMPIVQGSDLFEYKDADWALNSPLKPAILHDARQTPWPIDDKKYELLIALRVFQHLVPNQRECFLEARRVAQQIILVVPENYPNKVFNEREASGISQDSFVLWNDGVPPTIVEQLPGWLGTLYFWNRNSLRSKRDSNRTIQSKPSTPLSAFVSSRYGTPVTALARCLSSTEANAMFEELAKIHLFSRDWRSAFSVYAMLYLSGHEQYAWICHRLARRVENESLFNSLFENEHHKSRILKHISEQLGKEIRHIETTRSKLGYIGIASFRHKLDLANSTNSEPKQSEQRTPDIYEKVFDSSDEQKANLEVLLFESVSPTLLVSPNFYGAIEIGEFKSMLYEFIDGANEVGQDEWYKIEKQLLYQHWSVAPPAALMNDPRVDQSFARKILECILESTKLEILRKYIDKSSFENLLTFLDNNRTVLFELVDRMPSFIFHRDLCESNVLLDSKLMPKVIDWEQWALAPIGFGWSPLARESEVPKIDMQRIRGARSLPDDIGEHHLLLMAAIWASYSAIERKDYQLAAAWLKRFPLFVEMRVT
jgi:hypothetical protein